MTLPIARIFPSKRVRLSCAALLVSAAAAALYTSACSRTKEAPAPGITAAPIATASTQASSVASAVSPSANASAATAPSGAASPKGPPADLNVLLISIDSLRADMPWSGYPRPIAPRLTELEARSVSFTHAYSASSYTSMSLGGLLGGKLPGELKRDGFFFGTYAKECVLFPELLHDAGVRTVAGQAHGYFKNAGMDQGFDRWEIVPNITFKNTTDENITSPQLEAIAEKLLSDAKTSGGDARFFAWFHFLDPHDQYLAHEGVGPYGKTLRDRYDAEVTFTDTYVGKLIDFVSAQPWGARTAIVITSDHGEAFGDHKMFGHGFELFDNLVRVPLFFVIPGAAPRHIDQPRSALDLAPTMLALFGLPPRDAYRGTSLVPELYGAKPEPRDVALDLPATSDNDRRRALVSGSKKIVAGHDDGYLVMYDLATDPDEKTPIVKGDEHAEMAARYRAFVKTVTDVPPYACKETTCLNGAYLKKDGGP